MRSVWVHAPPVLTGGSFESETTNLHGLLEVGPSPVEPFSRSLNIDAQDLQDAQDNQYGRLLHERRTPAVKVWGFADVQDCKAAVSRKNPVNPVHPVHRCESIICPCSTLNRFPATRRQRLFQICGQVTPCSEIWGRTAGDVTLSLSGGNSPRAGQVAGNVSLVRRSWLILTEAVGDHQGALQCQSRR